MVNQIKEILQPSEEKLNQNTAKANKVRSSADMHIQSVQVN